MKLDPEELKVQVIRPTLEYLGNHNLNIEALLIAIAQCHQSQPSDATERCYGVYPIDVETHRRVWDGYLAFGPDLASKIRGLASQRAFLDHPDEELYTNLAYATAIAWAVYIKYPASQPNPDHNRSSTALQSAR